MPLKTDAIAALRARDKDPFVIAPRCLHDPSADTGSAAIDLRLGTWFVVLRQARIDCLKVQPPADQVRLANQYCKSHFVPLGESFFLHPRSFVLGVTLEWLRFPADISGSVIGKSSWGRRGLIIATATGVHPGFTGCLTLEITNVGELPIEMKPGMTICQLLLDRAETKNDLVDGSSFVGLRKPTIGIVKIDSLAERLFGPESAC